jgi:hypothetical protein
MYLGLSAVVVALRNPIANFVTLLLSVGLYTFYCVLASSKTKRWVFGYYVLYTLLLSSAMGISIYDMLMQPDRCLSSYAFMVGGAS